MHGFIRQLPEYRQAYRRGEHDERERVLGLVRERIHRARYEERCLDRESKDQEPNMDFEQAVKRECALSEIAVLEEIEKAVSYGWHR